MKDTQQTQQPQLPGLEDSEEKVLGYNLNFKVEGVIHAGNIHEVISNASELMLQLGFMRQALLSPESIKAAVEMYESND